MRLWQSCRPFDVDEDTFALKECLRTLGDKFPDSPRMDVLNGIRIEASQTFNVILTYYDEVLKASPANAVCGQLS